MKIERTRNATRNIITGTALKLYQIVVPFIMRTVMIYFMGIEYLGLNSLFVSVLQMLNLVELGIGSAMVFSMYKPIADDEHDEICALMNLYKWYYRIIGLVIAVIGCILLPFIPKLIKGDIPAGINIYIIYLLNLGATVLSYWLFAYRNSILQAHQRNDVIDKVSIIINTFVYISQIIFIIFFKSYYGYLAATLTGQALINIFTAVQSRKLYPEYSPKGKLEKEKISRINKKIKDLFTAKLGGVITNSADTVVISAFIGLADLAIYQNYFFIVNSIIGFITIIFNSCLAGIGNSLVTETEEKNYNDLENLTFLIFWILVFIFSCLLSLYQPFMYLWVGKKLSLNYFAVICFSFYFVIYELNALLNLYKDAGGLWHKDRFRPLVVSAANLGLNLITVKFIGIYGVILSTVAAFMFIGMPWILHNLFTSLFKTERLKGYTLRLLKYAAFIIVISAATAFVNSLLPFSGILLLCIRALICLVLPNLCVIVFFRKSRYFKSAFKIMDSITKGKLLNNRLFQKYIL